MINFGFRMCACRQPGLSNNSLSQPLVNVRPLLLPAPTSWQVKSDPEPYFSQSLSGYITFSLMQRDCVLCKAKHHILCCKGAMYHHYAIYRFSKLSSIQAGAQFTVVVAAGTKMLAAGVLVDTLITSPPADSAEPSPDVGGAAVSVHRLPLISTCA